MWGIVCVGHSWVPRNKRLEPQQGAALCYLILDSFGYTAPGPSQTVSLGLGNMYGKASETPLPQAFHQEKNKSGLQNLRWQQERRGNRKTDSFRPEKGELRAFESELDNLITSLFEGHLGNSCWS